MNEIDFKEGADRGDKLKGAEMLENGNLDIINGQGCLLLHDKTVLFGIKDGGEMGTIEELPSTPVTSHGFMSCAEITGDIGEKGKIYIHALDTKNFSELLQLMLTTLGGDAKVKNLQIRCDFSRQYINDVDEVKLTAEEIESYRNEAKSFTDNFTIEDARYGGVYPAKVVKAE